MRRSVLVLVLALLGSACVVRVHEPAIPVGAEIVTVAPPPPQVEVVTVAPGPGQVWIRGHWAWRGAWVWVPGSWELVRPGHHWVDGHWRPHRHGWVWIEGHWAR